MRKVVALVRASWLEAASYRMRSVLTLFGLLAAAVPFYFVARGLQSVVGDAIKTEGGDFFAFLVLGMASFAFVRTAISTIPTEIGGAISNGTFETLLGTPARTPTLIAGMAGYAFTWTVIRVAVFLAFASFMGAHFLWWRLPLGAFVMALIVFAHIPVGLAAGALIIAFRSSGPLQNAVIWISTVLGGIYYPTQAIPDYLKPISGFVPLMYGARALRRVMLEPTITWDMVAPDVLIVVAIGSVAFVLSTIGLVASLRYARRTGSLAQY